MAAILRDAGTLTDEEEELETTRPLLAILAAEGARGERRDEATAPGSNPWAIMSTTTATGTRWGDAAATPPTPGRTEPDQRPARPAEDTRQAGASTADPGINPFAPPEGTPPGQRADAQQQEEDQASEPDWGTAEDHIAEAGHCDYRVGDKIIPKTRRRMPRSGSRKSRHIPTS